MNCPKCNSVNGGVITKMATGELYCSACRHLWMNVTINLPVEVARFLRGNDCGCLHYDCMKDGPEQPPWVNALGELRKAVLASAQPQQSVKEQLMVLTPELRMEAMEDICKECGGNTPCQCWNDE